MAQTLCISATFLDPLFHGCDDDGRPEWPPAPLRLFQALLAGAHAGSRAAAWTAADQKALEWLERRDAPEIVAPRAHLSSGYVFYVPDNSFDKAPERQNRLAGKEARPHRMLDGQTVYFLWPLADEELAEAESQLAALRRMARQLLALGRGIDQVAGNGEVLPAEAAAVLPGERWRAWPDPAPDDAAWRVPRLGTTADLLHVYSTFVGATRASTYAPAARPSVYERLVYRAAGEPPARHYAAFRLESVSSAARRPAFEPGQAARLAAMLRHAACRQAEAESERFPGGAERYVAGHAGGEAESPPRFAYLPLPTLGHPHADGRIRRVLVAEPYGGDGRQARWARERLRGRALVSQASGPVAVLGRPDEDDFVLLAYIRTGRTWESVTPVVLPGYDDGKYDKALRLLLKAMQQAGLATDALEDATLRKAPFWPGAQHPRDYFRPDYLRGLPAWHVRLEFRQAVPGPLAVGAGRFAGLGLLAPVPD